MGDRGNVRLVFKGCAAATGSEESDANIFLYTHWGGTDLPYTLARALDRGRSRWDDPAYLARIIFSEMTEGSEKELTGYGISPWRCDEEHKDLIVHLNEKKVGTKTYEEFIQSILRTEDRGG